MFSRHRSTPDAAEQAPADPDGDATGRAGTPNAPTGNAGTGNGRTGDSRTGSPRTTRTGSTPVGAGTPVSRSPGGGKGRPTPRRTQAEAARRRPLVPTDRKAAAKSQRAAAKQVRDREYQAMQTGDERYLPARDKGPVRRYVRDYVDARRNLGEYFLPISIVMLLSTFLFSQNPTVGIVVILVLYLVVIATVVDAVWLSRVLKKRLHAKFGEDKVPKGTLMYGVLRAFQVRRTRLPRPQVGRGEFPA